MKVLIVAGGTAGHIIPALVVAEELQQKDKDLDILFVTTRKKQDWELILKKGFSLKKIFAGKFRKYFSLLNLVDIFKVVAGFFQSLFIILRFKPQIIFSKGGYISVPVVLASRILGKRIIIHESDFVLGLANRISFPFADKLAVSFPVEFYKNKKDKLFFSGNPVRNLATREKSYNESKTIFIIGGSQGARKINFAVSEILDEFLKDYKIIHLVGELDFEDVKKKKELLDKEKSKNYLIYPNVFDDKDYGELLGRADVVISRGGAGVISELATLGKASIIIPLRGHQEKNAEILEKNNAALVLRNEDLTSLELKNKIKTLLQDNELMNRLKNNISKFSSKNAASIISKEILSLGK